MVSSKDDLEEPEDDSLLVFLVETSNALVGRVGRVERQEVRREVEICGLGVMIEVWTTVPVAGTFDLIHQSTLFASGLETYVVVHLVDIGVD